MGELLFAPGALRLFLAAMVVVHHATRLAIGTWAVDIFFILSGYWVTVMYRDKYAKYSKPVAAFYTSRYLRLIPVYLVCQAIMMAGLFAVHDPKVAAGLPSAAWFARMLVIVTSAKQLVLLGPAWSLDIEVQFYLAVPILVYLWTLLKPELRRPALTAVAVLLFPLALIVKENQADLVYYVSFFLIGMANAIKPWKPTKTVGLASGAAFVLMVLACLALPSLRGYILGGQHVIDAAKFAHNIALNGILAFVFIPFVFYSLTLKSSSLDKDLGNMAYPVYLVHYPSQLLIGSNKLHLPIGHAAAGLLHIAVTAIVSVIIYILIDRPSDRFRSNTVKRLFGSKPTPSPKIDEPVPAASAEVQA
jgi:peptidoglycan/LPS O-acetylase OafA/YrhL